MDPNLLRHNHSFSSLFRPCSPEGVFEGSLAQLGSLLISFWLHVGRFGYPFWSILDLLIKFLTLVTRICEAPAKQSHTPIERKSTLQLYLRRATCGTLPLPFGFTVQPFLNTDPKNVIPEGRPQFSYASVSAKHLQNKRLGPSPKWNSSFAQPPLLPGPKRNLAAGSFNK